jgi:hypothetical protein
VYFIASRRHWNILVTIVPKCVHFFNSGADMQHYILVPVMRIIFVHTVKGDEQWLVNMHGCVCACVFVSLIFIFEIQVFVCLLVSTR